jgi:type 1 fimbriae regulatory protein FimB
VNNPIKFWQPNELLAVLREARKVSARNHCLILLAYKHGLRASEICRLRLEDVADGRLDCQRLKGSLHTNRPLESDPEPLLDEIAALRAWMREREDTGSIFLFISSRFGSGMTRQSVYDIFEDAAFRAGLPRGLRGPHRAKHTLASLAYRSGVDVVALQQLLGHKDPKSTLAYTHLSQDEAHAKMKVAMATTFASAAA